MKLLFSLLLPALLGAPALATYPYQVEDIPLPDGIPPEVGGLDFAPDGTLFVVLRRGDVFKATPPTKGTDFAWQHFATGFHNGCGLHAITPHKLRITQMAEMTEVEDTDKDGQADLYRRFAAGWGLSGNYHETTALCGDGHGGYYLAVGTASHNGPTFFHTLGDYSKFGRRGRNFSSVTWRGWVLHTDPEGTLTPFCSGFRMHNGIFRDKDGNIWCGDNQGDWKAATPLYHIEKGNFYGHPSSLVWDKDWAKDRDPLATYRADLDAYNEHRSLPAVQLPHKEMNRSASDPIQVPEEFGAFAGQLLLLDNNSTRISRIMLEKVGGEFQGACTHFLTGQGLRSGNNRATFSPDGRHLYVGQTVRGWGKLAEGLQRIRPTDQTPFDIEKLEILKDGFRVTFSEVLAANPPEGSLKFTSFTYQSRWTYGSPQEDKKTHRVTKIRKVDSKVFELTLEGMAAGRVYRLDLPELTSIAGSKVQNRLFFYTANKLP